MVTQRDIKRSISQYNKVIKQGLVESYVEGDYQIFKYSNGQIFKCRWFIEKELQPVMPIINKKVVKTLF